MQVLARHGVLASGLADEMSEAVKFRNVLVHLYAEVDNSTVLDSLRQLEVLDRFVESLVNLVG